MKSVIGDPFSEYVIGAVPVLAIKLTEPLSKPQLVATEVAVISNTLLGAMVILKLDRCGRFCA